VRAVNGVCAWSSYLDDAVVQAALSRNSRLRTVLPVGEVSSTQDVALTSAAGGLADGTVVLADRQFAGRGRSGKAWDDDRNGGTLALTVVLDAPEIASLAPHALGLAIVATAAAVVPAPAVPWLKWPNDVVVRSATQGELRKLSGILVERERLADRDVLLCGIGLNVDLRAQGPSPDRICLTSLAGAAPARPELLAVLLAALDDMIMRLVDGPRAMLADYRTRCETIGRLIEVMLPGGRCITGRASGVDDGGRLLVEVADRTEVIFSGTVRDVRSNECLRADVGAANTSRPTL
jgi:BirA family transcriptional regulator, biotin operon repressor / biotin---[acetyl-CoA-carboxylase] ligase